MTLLILGLALFLGAHSLRIFGDAWRSRFISQRGQGPWKGLYSLVSLVGFVLIIIGYGLARGGAPLFPSGVGARYAAYALVWLGFICVSAAYWPRNHIKQLLGDPMVAGAGLWALGHALVKTTPAALTLFGAFLVWALIDYVSLRARALPSPATESRASGLNTVLTVAAGSVLWGVFALYLHKWLIGVAPIA